MPYEYQQQAPPPTGEKVADIYIVQSVASDDRHAPSRELLAAIERLPASAQEILRAVVKGGFQAAVRK